MFILYTHIYSLSTAIIYVYIYSLPFYIEKFLKSTNCIKKKTLSQNLESLIIRHTDLFGIVQQNMIKRILAD